MKRGAALLWLVCVLAAGFYMSVRLYHGLNFRTDLMALLPEDQQHPEIQALNDKAMASLSRHVVLLVGSSSRETSRSAATTLAQALKASGEVDLSTQEFSKDDLRRMGAFYFPYREGLLSNADRQLLLNGKGRDVASHALARAFGTVGLANAGMLRTDPFFLLADFFMGLPVPASRMHIDDGMLTAEDGDKIWVMVAGELRHDPFALSTQDAVAAAVAKSQRNMPPATELLRLGAVFFAKAGADEAMRETSAIGIASVVGILLLVGLIFRGWGPLLLSLLAISTGILVAFAGSLLIFGNLHVGVLLFGTSLIGVAVDYSLQYCCEVFSPHRGNSETRLRYVFPAITLGASTTVIGYLIFLLAPFPGLHQIAAFSVIGLIGAWLTVVLWFPLLDHSPFPRHGKWMLSLASKFLRLWEERQSRYRCLAILGVAVLLGIAGLWRIHADDDIHHMQSLNPALVTAQNKITGLIGKEQDSQFFIVQAPDEETALQTEEDLIDRLRPLTMNGDLKSFQAMAEYIPSAARQTDNRRMVRAQLYGPLLVEQTRQLHLINSPDTPHETHPILTPADAALPWLAALELDKNPGTVIHMVLLDGVRDVAIVKAAAEGLNGVRFVDPAGDFSRLIGKYRQRALLLLAFSALLMAPSLVARYGLQRGLWLMLPPALAVLLAPALCSLAGEVFTFFDAMALVLILSIGVDYSIFCAETSHERKAATMLAVFLAACTALLSFGLLALSHVAAVHHFGLTMLVGIGISFLLAPMGRLIKQK